MASEQLPMLRLQDVDGKMVQVGTKPIGRSVKNDDGILFYDIEGTALAFFPNGGKGPVVILTDSHEVRTESEGNGG